MMTFYIGEEIKRYRKMWKSLAYHFSKEMELKGLDPHSQAAVFRYMVDKIYHELNDSKKNVKEVA